MTAQTKKLRDVVAIVLLAFVALQLVLAFALLFKDVGLDAGFAETSTLLSARFVDPTLTILVAVAVLLVTHLGEPTRLARPLSLAALVLLGLMLLLGVVTFIAALTSDSTEQLGQFGGLPFAGKLAGTLSLLSYWALVAVAAYATFVAFSALPKPVRAIAAPQQQWGGPWGQPGPQGQQGWGQQPHPQQAPPGWGQPQQGWGQQQPQQGGQQGWGAPAAGAGAAAASGGWGQPEHREPEQQSQPSTPSWGEPAPQEHGGWGQPEQPSSAPSWGEPVQSQEYGGWGQAEQPSASSWGEPEPPSTPTWGEPVQSQEYGSGTETPVDSTSQFDAVPAEDAEPETSVEHEHVSDDTPPESTGEAEGPSGWWNPGNR